MEYRKIAAHLTPKSACKQLEQELEAKSATQKEKIDHIIKHFDVVFEGIGKHRYSQIRLHIDETVNPVIQPQRRIPFARREQLEELLIELEEADVIERVEGPTNWVSNIVITPKSDPSKIRMNVDMTAVNKAIKRTTHVIPTVEELRYQMNGSAFFSKLDMSHGYNQFELDEDSRYVTVFYTHQGLRQFKRLTFGTTSAAEVFHYEMSQTLSGILQAANIYDDIIIFGRTQREHDLALIQVLQHFQDCGLTSGLSKRQLNAKSVKFFGIIFSAEGISPDSRKVEALQTVPSPTSNAEVRSFLGMTGFSSTFIPDYAVITTSLRKLTCKDVPFVWTKECQDAFQHLKDVLTQQTIMAYFDPNKDTKLIVDGSKKDGVQGWLLF